MLRPSLYSRLHSYAHGKISIANENEEALTKAELVDGRQHLCEAIGGEYYRIDCPYCTDTRRRLWISYLWGYREAGTRARNLFLCHCFNAQCFKQPGRARQLYTAIFSDFSHEAEDTISSGQLAQAVPVKAEWPGKMLAVNQLPLAHPARVYLEGRGFDAEVLSKKLLVGFCTEAEPAYRLAERRIVIPIHQDGKLAGWQARYVGEPATKAIPKYFSMPKMRRNQLLYNLDQARRYPYVIVTEGPTDVWAFGPEAVALFGKTASTHQLQLLTSCWPKIYVVLDGDAIIDATGIYDALGSKVEKILVKLPNKIDPGSLPTPVLRQLVLKPQEP